jgi:hypothetical protein
MAPGASILVSGTLASCSMNCETAFARSVLSFWFNAADPTAEAYPFTWDHIAGYRHCFFCQLQELGLVLLVDRDLSIGEVHRDFIHNVVFAQFAEALEPC